MSSGGGSGSQDSELQISAQVFVDDPPVLEYDVFNFWLSNLSVDKAAEIRFKDRGLSEAYKPLLLDETQDQYRIFNLLEHSLANPALFVESCVIPSLPIRWRKAMIDLYYDIDATVARHLMGKKLDYRHDCDEIAGDTNLSTGYVRRHHDNFRRVYKFVMVKMKELEKDPSWGSGEPSHHQHSTHSSFSGPSGGSSANSGGTAGNIHSAGDQQQVQPQRMNPSMLAIISNSFQLSPELTEKYAVIVFFCKHRVETQKRWLADLEFSHFHGIGLEMIKSWTTSTRLLISPLFLETLQRVRDLFGPNPTAVDDYYKLVLAQLAVTTSSSAARFPSSKFQWATEGLASHRGGAKLVEGLPQLSGGLGGAGD